MSDRTFEWPYITRLTKEQKDNYKSNLPENMDDYTVRRLAVSELWSPYDLRSMDGVPTRFIDPAVLEDTKRFNKTSSMWQGIFIAASMLTIWESGHLYSMNSIRNYELFRTESWPKYLRKRATPTLMLGWMVFRLGSGIYFGDYPSPF
jgi:hypothetical protein